MDDKLHLLLTSNFSSLDESTQEEIYKNFYKFVYRIALYVLKDHDEAEDVVHEAFIKTIYHAPPVENERQLRAWIRVVTRNLTLNIQRKNKMMIYQDIESNLINIGQSNQSPEHHFETKMFEENIVVSLAEIKQEQRTLLEMKWKNHSSNKDIAVLLGSTESAIKQRLHRAREALRKKLNQKWSYHDE